MLHIAVCDRDRAFAEQLRALAEGEDCLRERRLHFHLYGEGPEYLRALEAGAYHHLVFLELGEGAGVELGRRLRERFSFYETLLVYHAAHPGEAGLPGLIATCPFGLLAEPVSAEELRETLQTAADSLFHSPGLFVYRRGRAVFQVRKGEIVCLESMGRNIELTLLTGNTIRFIGALKHLAGQFGQENFIRPHLSYIVNLDHVLAYHSRHLELVGGKAVPISEKRAETVREAALRYWKQQRFTP